MENFYNKKGVQKYVKKLANPGFNQHKTSLPTRIVIVGGTGSMKTTTLLNFIKKAKDTFSFMIVCCKSKEEPLYLYLESQLKGLIKFYEDGVVPDVKEVAKLLSGDQQALVVFDDLVMEKDQKKISEYWIRSRKFNISVFYLTQDYFKCPKTIRINSSAIWLKKLGSSTRDLNLILSDFNLGMDRSQLYELYKYATEEPLSFLYIDIAASMDHRFRKNFLEILNT